MPGRRTIQRAIQENHKSRTRKANRRGLAILVGGYRKSFSGDRDFELGFEGWESL